MHNICIILETGAKKCLSFDICEIDGAVYFNVYVHTFLIYDMVKYATGN